MQIRKSKVLQKLRNGEKVSCIKINLGDAKLCEMAALAGFDCVWVDQEHVGYDWSTVAAQVWATKAHDTDILVRVPRGSYSNYIKPLELDATGIMVPHIMSLADAKEIVYRTRFHPIGRRAIDGGNADGGYTRVNFNRYLQEANEQRFVILQIEDPEPLKELEAIAGLPGYDMLFFGPGDFSQGIGAPGEWNNSQLNEARKRISEVAKKHGKFAGTVGSSENLKELHDMGYQFVSTGSDVVGLTGYFNSLVEASNGYVQSSNNSYMESKADR